jgi:hypothetical protein
VGAGTDAPPNNEMKRTSDRPNGRSPLISVFDGRMGMVEDRPAGWTLGFGLCFVLCLLAPASEPADQSGSTAPSPSPFARCEAECMRAFGQMPQARRDALEKLKRLSGTQAKYPDLPKGTRGSGNALHELLIAPDGRVTRVWTVREPSFEPRFPAFNQAIVVALQGWQYAPLTVEGRAVPVCLMVTTNINWKQP